MRLDKLALTSFFVLALPVLSLAAPRDFTVKAAESRATFESKAQLETFTGVSNAVSGSVRLDPADLSSASGEVRVPVASIRTGIDLRDEHLRGPKWLDAERYPNVAFTLERVEGASSLAEGQEASVILHGRLSLHGVSKPAAVSAKLLLQGGKLTVKARFKIKLADHGVEIPSVVSLKVAEEIVVRVVVVAG